MSDDVSGHLLHVLTTSTAAHRYGRLYLTVSVREAAGCREHEVWRPVSGLVSDGLISPWTPRGRAAALTIGIGSCRRSGTASSRADFGSRVTHRATLSCGDVRCRRWNACPHVEGLRAFNALPEYREAARRVEPPVVAPPRPRSAHRVVSEALVAV